MTQQETDRHWLDALAGRPVTGADEDLVLEARGLRAGILAREVAPAPPMAVTDARREHELIARARRAGLIPRPAAALWGGWRGIGALAAAASVIVVVGFLMRPGALPEAETVRSGPGGIVRIEATDALALRERIAAELRAAGVESVAYERLGAFGIDADLPSPVPPEVERVLRRHRIPVPVDGVLNVEIAEAAPR